MIASLVDKIFFLTIATLFEKSSLFIKKEKKKSELDLRIQHAKKEVSSQYQAETDQNMREKIKAEGNKLESFSTELGALGAEVQGEQPAHPEKKVSKAEKDQTSSTENP